MGQDSAGLIKIFALKQRFKTICVVAGAFGGR